MKFFVWNFSFVHSHLVANILEQDHAQKRYISISACLFENEADFEISNSCHRIFETISVLKMHLNTIFTIFYYFSFVIMIVKTQKKKIFQSAWRHSENNMWRNNAILRSNFFKRIGHSLKASLSLKIQIYSKLFHLYKDLLKKKLKVQPLILWDVWPRSPAILPNSRWLLFTTQNLIGIKFQPQEWRPCGKYINRRSTEYWEITFNERTSWKPFSDDKYFFRSSGK